MVTERHDAARKIRRSWQCPRRVGATRAASRRYCRSCREPDAVRADASSARRRECARAETHSIAAVAMHRASFPGECRSSHQTWAGERASASDGKKLCWADICGASPDRHRRASLSPRRSALGQSSPFDARWTSGKSPPRSAIRVTATEPSSSTYPCLFGARPKPQRADPGPARKKSRLRRQPRVM